MEKCIKLEPHEEQEVKANVKEEEYEDTGRDTNASRMNEDIHDRDDNLTHSGVNEFNERAVKEEYKDDNIQEESNHGDVAIEDDPNFIDVDKISAEVLCPTEDVRNSESSAEVVRNTESTKLQSTLDKILSSSAGKISHESEGSICAIQSHESEHQGSSEFSSAVPSVNNYLNSQNLYTCNECNFSTIQYIQILNHTKEHEGEASFNCINTGSKTSKPGKRCRSSRKESVQCEFCDYVTSDKSHLKRHIRIHTGDRPFKCSFCEYSSTRKSTIKDHTRMHTGEKPFQCPSCDHRTSTSSHIKRHIRRVHSEEKSFKCLVCDYRTSEWSYLQKHVNGHTGDHTLSCDFCDYKTSDKAVLRRHVMTHTGEKPFNCDQCPYAAARKADIKIHSRVHAKKVEKVKKS